MEDILHNQSLNSHMLFFDPIDRKIEPMPPLDLTKAPTARGMANRVNSEFDELPGVRALATGGVEIALYAPDATNVVVSGIGGDMPKNIEMTRGEDGYWRASITGMSPGFHYHEYFVDGARTVNPMIPFGYGCGRTLNYLEMPDPAADFYLLKDVPHGVLRMEHIKSELTGRFRNAWIYTPPGYDNSGDKRYPVMYIQHGGGENEVGWFWQGKLNYIADNLLAEGKCAEMIIVCCAGYAIKKLENGKCKTLDYTDVMVNEIVPFIDANYRTLADREYRAIAGLSMGGGQARAIAHTHPEVFANLGQFSCGGGFIVKGESLYGHTDYSELFKTPEHYNSIMKLTFISCGTDDPRHAFTCEQVKQLADKGYNVEYHAYPGDHEWNVWRLSARDFMIELYGR